MLFFRLVMMTFHNLVVVILIVSIFVPYKTVSGPSVANCHESCSCDPVDMYQDPDINVQCGERNLTKVPIMTFTEPVSILNVSFNELATLEKETFFHYKTINYLYLQRCRLRNISEEAFHCLVKLTFVDLSDNLFTSVSPNLFIGNQHLNQLILRGNSLVDLQWNATLLNGTPHLSKLDLHSCKLKKLSTESFSLLRNLQYIDISNNELELLNYDTLSSHKQLEDVNLENNQWKCGDHFYDLLCWVKDMEAVPHNRTVKCRHKNGAKEVWTPAKQSSLCRLNTTPSANSPHKTDVNTSWTLNTTVIWSNISEVSPNTTLSPTTQYEEENDTTGAIIVATATLIKVVILIVILFLIFVLRFSVSDVQKYKKLPPKPWTDDEHVAVFNSYPINIPWKKEGETEK